jgi:molybdate transport system permease protein
VRRLFDATLIVAVGLVLAFLLLPVVALFIRIAPADLFDALWSDVALDALWVSLKTGLIAHFFVLLVGTPAAYFLATKRFRGRGVLITLIELPLVLPPAVAGIALLALFSRRGLLGEELYALGIQIPLTQVAVVIAVAFVAAPFYVRQAIASFETVDRALIDAAASRASRRRCRSPSTPSSTSTRISPSPSGRCWCSSASPSCSR